MKKVILKRQKRQKYTIINYISVFSLIIICFLTLGFSSLQNSSIVTDIGATIRIEADIRVTAVHVSNTASSAVSNWEDYNVNSIMGSVSLPNRNSTVTYEVTVTNFGNQEMGILDITGLPNNLTYSISNYNLKNTLCDDNNSSKCSLGSVTKLLITVKYSNNGYNSNNTTYLLNLDFDFRDFVTITYTYLEGDYPTKKMRGDNLQITLDNNIESDEIKVSENGGVTYTLNNEFTVNNHILNISEIKDDTTILYWSKIWYKNCRDSSDTLNCKIVMTATGSDSSISFSSMSSNSNGNGVYYTSNLNRTEDIDGDGTGDRVYYYRGAVTNNYVLFGGFCWRIVRTNEDSSTRLIYGGSPTNGSCPQTGTSVTIGTSAYNSNSNSNAYVGYMYGVTGGTNANNTHANTNNSTIKSRIDTWYTSNLASYSSFLADYPFCNDRSITSGNGYGTQASQYGPYNRLNANKNPQLKCPQEKDKFSVNTENGNGALRYPIALLSADEFSYAGTMFNTSTSNTSYYLYTNSALWTMSPSDYYGSSNNNRAAYVFYVEAAGRMRISDNITTSKNIRPAINILSTVIISSGSGAYNSPFQLSLS